MGRFLNPDNSAFQVILNSKIYVDKTELLEYTNSVLNTDQALICNSRPRRFGKSITANMLSAYYSRGSDSAAMFENTLISSRASYREHLNRYDVIHFDVQWCLMDAGAATAVVSYITDNVLGELRIYYPEVPLDDVKTLYGGLSRINQATGRKFIVIIDEWDILIREEASNPLIQMEYINFLRGLFKGTEPTRFLHLAYLTGILPIKKVKTQSALNNFDEFTMLDPGVFAPYIGFTETEIRQLCNVYDRDFNEVKHWYDGYLLAGRHVYNPKAVVSVMLRGSFQSYWSKTGTYESILPLITMDFDGLRTAIIEMISGASVPVEVNSFQNDMVTFTDKDDVLTLLIHMGYLAYSPSTKTAFIPNEEIRQEFIAATKKTQWNEFVDFYRKSAALLDATLDMDSTAVAKAIEDIHTTFASTIQYNDENSLSSVLTIAYLAAMSYYFMPIREMPAGRGFADYVFIPKPEYLKEIPALLVELKWNQSADTALQQIRDRKYTQTVANYTGNILLVGISYDKKRKQHTCAIENVCI